MDTPVVPRVRRRLPIVVGALALALAGLYVASAATHGPSRAPPPQWLASNTTTHTITLTLIAAYSNALSGFNFNGYGHGKMVISVPVGSHVTVIFRNRSAVPHSALVTTYASKTSTKGFSPVFSGASSPDAARGIAAGQTQRFSFVAVRVGTYALVCAVPGHAAAGMWDVLQVTWSGKAALRFGKVARTYTYKTADGRQATLDFPVYVRGNEVTHNIFTGYALFDSECYRCHGTDAIGGLTAPDLRAALNAGMTREQFISVTLDGRPGMPPWRGYLNRKDVEAIYEYVKARSVNVLPFGRPNGG
ncbi:MAG TPA: sulfocyanin-like copper-binding protein [Chloroflexota bacterium]|nr:sulfocyanin-like copper-binding protein [Chloroflexota bacterium]